MFYITTTNDGNVNFRQDLKLKINQCRSSRITDSIFNFLIVSRTIAYYDVNYMETKEL